jgi:hypothetical protein
MSQGRSMRRGFFSLRRFLCFLEAGKTVRSCTGSARPDYKVNQGLLNTLGGIKRRFFTTANWLDFEGFLGSQNGDMPFSRDLRGFLVGIVTGIFRGRDAKARFRHKPRANREVAGRGAKGCE